MLMMVSTSTLVQPLCGQAMVLLTSSCRSFFGFILSDNNHIHISFFLKSVSIRIDYQMQENWDFTHRAKSANCLGSDRSRPGIPPTGIFFPEIEVKTSSLCAYFWRRRRKALFCFWNSTCHVFCVVRVGLVRRDLLATNLQDPVFPVLRVIWNRWINFYF